jgi:hypothetical protein
LLGNDPCGYHRCDHLEPELLIAIKDQVFLRGFKWKRLAQLLDDPTARRMLRDVNVQDAPTRWLSRYCHVSLGKTLKNHEQKVNTEEKLALALHRNFLILLGKPPLRQIALSNSKGC